MFEHPQFGKVRVTGTSEKPLFCLADICKVLEIKNATRAKTSLKVGGLHFMKVTNTQKNQYGESKKLHAAIFTFISELNLYRLIMRSNKPQAEPFQDWVCGEVLPQIRKTGGYIPLKEGDSEEDVRKRAEEVMKATLEQKDKLIADLEHDVDRLLPKALYVDNVLESVSCYTTTQIAKELGMTAQELNRRLCQERIQYYQSGQYMLYADYAHQGLAKSRTGYDLFLGSDEVHTRTYLVWTEKGRKFLHSMLLL